MDNPTDKQRHEIVEQIQRSDDLAEALGAGECYHVLNGVYQNHTDCEDIRDVHPQSLKEALDNSTRITTVPVTQLLRDGAKQVVGHAQIHRQGDELLATFTIESSCVSKHLGSTLGPFSIGTADTGKREEVILKAVENAKQQRLLRAEAENLITELISHGITAKEIEKYFDTPRE
jgi:hypothetical protein